MLPSTAAGELHSSVDTSTSARSILIFAVSHHSLGACECDRAPEAAENRACPRVERVVNLCEGDFVFFFFFSYFCTKRSIEFVCVTRNCERVAISGRHEMISPARYYGEDDILSGRELLRAFISAFTRKSTVTSRYPIFNELMLNSRLQTAWYWPCDSQSS